MTHSDTTTAELAISGVTSKLTYVGSAATLVFGLSYNELAAVAALASTVTMLILTIWLKLRADFREQREHELRVMQLRGECEKQCNGCKEAK